MATTYYFEKERLKPAVAAYLYSGFNFNQVFWIVERVTDGLAKLKGFQKGAATLGNRDKLVKQLKADLTFFENFLQFFEAETKECVLVSEIYEYATFLSVEKQDIREYEQIMNVLKSITMSHSAC